MENDLLERQSLDATIDVQALYCSAMTTCFGVELTTCARILFGMGLSLTLLRSHFYRNNKNYLLFECKKDDKKHYQENC